MATACGAWARSGLAIDPDGLGSGKQLIGAISWMGPSPNVLGTGRPVRGLPSPSLRRGQDDKVTRPEGRAHESHDSDVQRVTERAQCGFEERLALGRMGVDCAGDILQPSAHFQRQAEG
jgi:hypothetical protein